MLQKLIAYTLVVLLVVSTPLSAVSAEEITDVSPDHWAYENVRELVDKGYLSLHEGGEFRGKEAVTRYKLAEVVALMLNEISQEQHILDEEEILTLRDLATEFRSELVEVASENKELAEKIEQVANTQKIVEEDMINTNDRMAKVEEQLNELMDEVQEEAFKLRQLREEVEELEIENENLRGRVSSLETRLGETDDEEVTSLNDQVKTLRRRFYWMTAGTTIVFLALILEG